MPSFVESRSRHRTRKPFGAALVAGAIASLALGGIAQAQSASPAAAGEAYTLTATTTDLGTFLTGEDGKTLYYFLKDTAPGKSVCEGDCATNWPPFTLDAGETVAAGDGVTGVVNTFARSDGSTQVSYDGRPLYYFAADKAAGDAVGQGKGGVWFVAATDGSAPAAPVASGAPAASPAETYTVNAATTDVGTFLTGEDGKTLYVFLKDTAPGASVCEGDCIANWPAFLLESDEALAAGDGVTGVLSTFARSDGTMQVAYDGRPVYYFIGDKAAGTTAGQGIGDVWYVAAVDGSVPAAPAASAAP